MGSLAPLLLLLLLTSLTLAFLVPLPLLPLLLLLLLPLLPLLPLLLPLPVKARGGGCCEKMLSSPSSNALTVWNTKRGGSIWATRGDSPILYGRTQGKGGARA